MALWVGGCLLPSGLRERSATADGAAGAHTNRRKAFELVEAPAEEALGKQMRCGSHYQSIAWQGPGRRLELYHRRRRRGIIKLQFKLATIVHGPPKGRRLSQSMLRPADGGAHLGYYNFNLTTTSQPQTEHMLRKQIRLG